MPFIPAGTNALPPSPMTQGSTPTSPENFLIAAADLGKNPALSAPVPKGRALGGPAQSPKRRAPDIKVVR